MRSEEQICQLDAPSRLRIHYLCEKRLCLSTRMKLKAIHFLFLYHVRLLKLRKKKKKRIQCFKICFLDSSCCVSLCLQLRTQRGGGNEESKRYLNQLVVINVTRIEMTWKHITKALRRFNPSLFSFLFFFPSTETALGPIWFGFSMNYHGLDPVSADKAPKCPSCILILPMNIQQLALISPLFSHLYWYLTVICPCSHQNQIFVPVILSGQTQLAKSKNSLPKCLLEIQIHETFILVITILSKCTSPNKF